MLKKYLAILLLFSLVLQQSFAQYYITESEMTELENILTTQEQQITKLENELIQSKKELTEALNYQMTLEKEIEELNRYCKTSKAGKIISTALIFSILSGVAIYTTYTNCK